MEEVRWVVEKGYITSDQDYLQQVICYPPGVKKEQVKQEHMYSNQRSLLVVERTEEADKYERS